MITILTIILIIVVPILVMDRIQVQEQAKKEEIHQKIKAGLMDQEEEQ